MSEISDIKTRGSFSYKSLNVAIFIFIIVITVYVIVTFINSYNSNVQPEDMGRTIDLLNLVIVGGGAILAIMTLLVSLKLHEWDSQHERMKENFKNAKDAYNDSSIEVKKGAETLEKSKEKYLQASSYYESAKQEIQKMSSNQTLLIESKVDFINDFFTGYARGLSKFHSYIYEDAIEEFEKILAYFNFLKKEMGKEKESEYDKMSKLLDDVYYHLGRCFFKKIDFSKDELDVYSKAQVDSMLAGKANTGQRPRIQPLHRYCR